VDVRDCCGRRIFDWIKDYASDPNDFDYMVWKCDVEQLNKIVKYLQERSVESSAVYRLIIAHELLSSAECWVLLL
jgi:hypothetical protein